MVNAGTVPGKAAMPAVHRAACSRHHPAGLQAKRNVHVQAARSSTPVSGRPKRRGRPLRTWPSASERPGLRVGSVWTPL